MIMLSWQADKVSAAHSGQIVTICILGSRKIIKTTIITIQ